VLPQLKISSISEHAHLVPADHNRRLNTVQKIGQGCANTEKCVRDINGTPSAHLFVS